MTRIKKRANLHCQNDLQHREQDIYFGAFASSCMDFSNNLTKVSRHLNIARTRRASLGWLGKGKKIQIGHFFVLEVEIPSVDPDAWFLYAAKDPDNDA